MFFEAFEQHAAYDCDDGRLHVGLHLAGSFRAEELGGGDEVADAEDDGLEGRGATGAEGDAAPGQQFVETTSDGTLEQGEFIGVVIVEGGAVNGGGLGDVLHRDGVELLYLHQLDEGLLEELAGAQDAGVDGLLRDELRDVGEL